MLNCGVDRQTVACGRIVTRDWLKGIAIVLLGIVLASAARGETVFPARTGRVVDEAGLLSQPARDSLTRQLAEHERTTSNQVVVVTVRSLQGMRIEVFSLALANRWAVGQARRNNGVVLLVAPNERQVRIEVGIGLERRLTNAIAADIIEQRMLPAFRAGRPEAGIQDGVNGILAALGDAYQMVERPRWSPQADEAGGRLIPIPLIAVLVGIGLVVILLNVLTGGRLFNSGSGGGHGWRSDDDDWQFGGRSSSRSSFGGHGFGGGSSFSSHSSGGGSFHGGGASGHW
jgi:uncharacterized protein